MNALTPQQKAELFECYKKMSHEELLKAIMELTEVHENAMKLLRKAAKGAH